VGHFYYLIGIFITLSLFSNLLNCLKYYKIRHWLETFKKVTRKEPIQSDFREKTDYNIYTVYNSFSIFQFLWYLIGIASKSWYIYLVILFFDFLVNNLIFNMKSGILGRIIFLVYLVFKFIIVFGLILNHFHFHYDLLLLLNN